MNPRGATPRTNPIPRSRARRWALLSALRILRESVQKHRLIPLPALLRLYQRRWAEAASRAHEPAPDKAWLAAFYRHEQPFTQTDWPRWRRIVKSAQRRPASSARR